MNDTDLLARLIKLETQLVFQEHTIDTLNTVVTQLRTTVDLLVHEVNALKAQLRTVAPSLHTGGADERPPHY